MPYIIKFIYFNLNYEQYYGGKSYQYGGEKYAKLTNFEGAKRYKTKEAAERAYEKCVVDGEEGYHACVNAPNNYKIVEVGD